MEPSSNESEAVMLGLRALDPDRDRARIIELVAKHFEDWRQQARAKFEWLYLHNPLGRARVWGLEDEGGRLVGLSAAFPRRLRADGSALDAWVLGDFCIEPEHRSLGPALRLQRAVSEAVERGEVDAWYDFPSRTMQAIYARMGYGAAGEMLRLVHPLKVDEIVVRKFRGPVAASMTAIGNAALRARDALRAREPAIEVRDFDGSFPAGLEPGESGLGGVRLDRSPEYLHWRYRMDPRGRCETLSAWRDGECGGFLVFRARESGLGIVDAFGVRDEEFLKRLILEVVDRARERGAARVTAGISKGHPWHETFEELGFHPREGAAFVVFTRPGVLADGTRWLLMSGDRDL